METFEAISIRVSVREYQDKPIEKPLLEKLVDAGRKAPTARKVEPWEFIVVTEKKAIQALGEKVSPNGSFLKGAAACIVIFSQDTKYYLEDCCAATENILLTVADVGLGACWIAGDKKPYDSDVAAMLGVPAGFKLIGLIALGWPAKQVAQVKSRSLRDVLHWERF